jgi:ABC-type microcin C transport system permease subunit YejB
MFFNGLPEMPVDNVTVKDVIITDATGGPVLNQTSNVTISNVDVQTASGNATIQAKNSNNLTVDGKNYKTVSAKGVTIKIK